MGELLLQGNIPVFTPENGEIGFVWRAWVAAPRPRSGGAGRAHDRPVVNTGDCWMRRQVEFITESTGATACSRAEPCDSSITVNLSLTFTIVIYILYRPSHRPSREIRIPSWAAPRGNLQRHGFHSRQVGWAGSPRGLSGNAYAGKRKSIGQPRFGPFMADSALTRRFHRPLTGTHRAGKCDA